MHKPSPAFCPEGLPYLGFFAFVTLVCAILGWPAPALVFLGLTTLTLNFFRNPLRVVPSESGVVVSAADGKVVKVGPMPDPLTGEERTAICVFMNVFNVHVNRFPVAGKVLRIGYIPGKFCNASFDKASKDNERNIVALETPEGERFTVVQIAGLIARRIVCWAEEGDSLERGEPFGVIKFGSRVDLYLPDGYVPCVTTNDKTLAGQTILARKEGLGLSS